MIALAIHYKHDAVSVVLATAAFYEWVEELGIGFVFADLLQARFTKRSIWTN